MGSGAAALVREATDLVGLIGEVTHIKRAGSAASAMAMCPFHPNRNTPAMSADGERGLYHCFGCGASGDALTFTFRYGEAGSLITPTSRTTPRLLPTTSDHPHP